MYRKISKMSIILITLMLIFVCIVAPYYNSRGNIKYKNKTNGPVLHERRLYDRVTEHQCKYNTIVSRLASEITKYKNIFYSIEIDKEEIPNAEFAAVVIEQKFRPQEARRDMTDGKTNKCLLFEANNGKIKKGDFVVFL